ncbi:Phosphatidylinositol N-acetylglucosaminyltransferase subunit Q [Amphibalanus amphitrite]|uniref:Phosphatidylinositol N-acetylglucosaminyltransferase subunit Q n=1 Tax=Amphibalanus amphitrite TaxID=1232801 RepID=A0A6A4VZ46_AMPAM|nr:Phosphatidylinositol N-acetylglucosaminyltransferase subunit Q [Amphibalanus amphitrite]
MHWTGRGNLTGAAQKPSNQVAMITVLLPEELTRQQQGSLTGLFERDPRDPRRAALVVTGLQYRLPEARSLGYLISPADSRDFSGAVFAYLHNYVVITNGRVPRVLRCVIDGQPVPAESVTLALYSPAAVRGADMLRGSLAGVGAACDAPAANAQTNHAPADGVANGRRAPPAPDGSWDPLQLMVRAVLAAEPAPAARARMPLGLGIGWLQWLVLELCSLAFVGPPWPAAAAGAAAAGAAALRIGWLQWALLELALLCRVSQLHRLLVWLRVDVRSASRSLLSAPARCSSLLAQCLLRLSQVARLAMHRGRSVVWLGCVCALVCDVALGVILTRLVQRRLDSAALLKTVTELSTGVMLQLQSLLQWMMGAPAGLKLNTPLTTALGSFFLYHVQLWGAFITLVTPTMITAIQLLLPMGYLGASFLFSLLSDLLSLATFHVYCVYVYATKLYQLEVRWLVRLWRLFRGRRWNPEKQRVETWPYTLEQLFLGTLCFTILLFLFPTVLLYYAVFVVLRLTVLAAVGLLTLLIYVINVNPLLVVVSWLARANCVAGSLLVTVLRQDRRSLVTRVELTTAPLGDTLRWFWCPADPGLAPLRWGQLLDSLVRGNLVYPV